MTSSCKIGSNLEVEITSFCLDAVEYSICACQRFSFCILSVLACWASNAFCDLFFSFFCLRDKRIFWMLSKAIILRSVSVVLDLFFFFIKQRVCAGFMSLDGRSILQSLRKWTKFYTCPATAERVGHWPGNGGLLGGCTSPWKKAAWQWGDQPSCIHQTEVETELGTDAPYASCGGVAKLKGIRLASLLFFLWHSLVAE